MLCCKECAASGAVILDEQAQAGMEVATHHPDYRWSALRQGMPASGDAEQGCFWTGKDGDKAPS